MGSLEKAHLDTTANIANEELKTAHLKTIDFSRLLAQENQEVCNLLSACQESGFFYVDLQGQCARGLLEDEEKVYEMMQDYFDQPLAIKMRDKRGTHKHG